MEKYLILTGLFKPTALKVSGEYGSYHLNFQRIPWIKSDLKHEISELLTFDRGDRCYLDPDRDAPLSYAEWRDSLSKVGIGIQAWLVAIESDRTRKLSIWDTACDFPLPKNPTFSDYPEWGWRFSSSQGIEMRACCTGAEKLGYKPLEFLLPEVKPAISYVWPSEEPYDEKGLREFEALLFSLLENSELEQLPQTSTATDKATK
jgi:hypothetical protein